MIHENIVNRRSTVLFSESPVDDSNLAELFSAARLAPSSLNIQPWRFIYAKQGDAEYDGILACLTEANQEWAKNAPVLIVSVAQVISDYKNRANSYAWHDTAMAYSNLVFQATDMGLSLHPMAGFSKLLAIEKLAIPEKYEPLIIAALGRKSNSDDFPAKLKERESTRKSRKPLEEFVFYGKFNQGITLKKE